MQCELCGKNCDVLYKTLIEGIKMDVCQSCSGHGKIITEVKPASKKSEERPRSAFVKEEKKETFYRVRDNYAAIIRRAREKSGLTNEEFAKKVTEKESLISHIENGKTRPSLVLARKLEKILGVSLIEEYEEKHEKLHTETGELTLGDFIKIKERKK